MRHNALSARSHSLTGSQILEEAHARWGEIGRPIHLAEAGAAFGLKPKDFSKLFSRRTGLGFCDWSARTRLSRATGLLVTSDQSITEIASDVGYESLGTFERAFKRHVGVTPREYRSALRPKTAPPS